MTQLSHHGIPLATFTLGEPSLDEVFLALTGSPAHETNPGREPR